MHLRQKVGLFIYGSLVHFALLRATAHWGYSPRLNPSVVNHPVTNLAIPILGGGLFAGFMTSLYKGRQQGAASGDSVLVDGLCSVLATFLTVEITLFTLSFLLEWRVSRNTGLGFSFLEFLLGLISVHTYGIFMYLYWLPPSFVAGLIAGILLSKMSPNFPKPG